MHGSPLEIKVNALKAGEVIAASSMPQELQ